MTRASYIYAYTYWYCVPFRRAESIRIPNFLCVYMYCIAAAGIRSTSPAGTRRHGPGGRRTLCSNRRCSPGPCMHLPSTYVPNCSVTSESIRTRHANLVTKTGLNHSNAQLVCRLQPFYQAFDAPVIVNGSEGLRACRILRLTGERATPRARS